MFPLFLRVYVFFPFLFVCHFFPFISSSSPPPRCGHCKKLAPEFEKAASRLKGTVQLAKVTLLYF